MAREVHDLEPCNVVALGHGALDLHRSAVPILEQERHTDSREPALEPREVEVVGAAVTLGVGDLGRVTPPSPAATGPIWRVIARMPASKQRTPSPSLSR